ncbi:YfhO family protein [Myxococcus sp. CA033]|uniref:YfhO family protein n=1 Tax=Myxococcus sp. CA033 TaxID=2741516 RepID=UPI00157B10EA|nr:YfhO family protein [Myxococcus sp. CA033]NTX38254.1 YfhO family protein [Myxococcus sp. CA033]
MNSGLGVAGAASLRGGDGAGAGAPPGPQLPPRDTAIVECAEPLPEASAGLTGTVKVERPSPEKLIVDVEASEAAVLVVNDAFQPGWTAMVDGSEVPILPANVAVRAVAVPAGQHRVEMLYRTPGLRAGLLVGFGTLLTLCLLGVARRVR